MASVRRWLPPAVVIATAALFVAAGVVTLRGSYAGGSDDAFNLAITVALFAFPIVGAILVRRYPENLIGWLFCATGPLFGLQLFSSMYVENYILAGGETGGFADFTLWVGIWTGPIAYSLVTAFLMLLFPTGHLSSRRWRPVALLAAGSIALVVLGSVFRRQLDNYPQLVNPYGIGATFGDVLDAATGIGWILFSISVLLAGVSLIARFRRSKGVERQQMKWMALAASFLLVAQFSWWISEELGSFLTSVAFVAIPLAVCVAILRYRLYDIDVIINRALVYGLLTAVLGLVYVTGVVGVGGLVREMTGQEENNLVVAASTLAVAGLFRPARTRIQDFIDRRFYRGRYDAQQAIVNFSAKMRDQIDLDSLASEMAAVVRDTVQPTHVSLWIRSQITLGSQSDQ
jgi:N-terminal 7TM region of histidine kinase